MSWHRWLIHWRRTISLRARLLLATLIVLAMLGLTGLVAICHLVPAGHPDTHRHDRPTLPGPH